MPMHLDDSEARRRAAAGDHGVLATLQPSRGVDAVPVCFVVVGDVVATPIDRVKPKSTSSLARLRNLDLDPRAALLVEHWDPTDWSRLWWVRLTLRRSVEDPDLIAQAEGALREKYVQYASAPFDSILTFRITAIAGWSAATLG
jgi:PPOX class probable F420-dependent enzyme